MLSYIGKRILSLIPVLFVVSFVVFLVVYMIPGGPATAILGLEASADQINALNAQLGFDRPFLVQYGDWIVNVFQGNWGDSFCNRSNCLIFWTNNQPCNSCAVNCISSFCTTWDSCSI